MRFPRLSSRSTATTTASPTGSAAQPAPTQQATVIPCTYHGWVMLPMPAVQDENAPPNGDAQRRLPFSYDKLVEMAKRVGVAQTQKSRGKKADRATTVITEGSVRIVSRKHEEGAMPLLHAAINTVICTLISKRTGVAVIVAHTWDGRGNRGIGCDVVRLKPRGCIAFKASIQTSIDALNRRNAEARATATANAEVPPPYSSHDPNAPPPPPITAPSGRAPRLRRRSTLAENEGADGGYMGVESFLTPDYEEPEDLDFSGDFDADDTQSTSGGYMDICGPGQDEYLDVAPAATCSTDEPPMYAEIEPSHPFAPRDSDTINV